jgi:hypothetical protein
LALRVAIDGSAPAAAANRAAIAVAHTAAGQALTDDALAAVALWQTAGMAVAVSVTPGIDDVLALEILVADGAAFAELLPVVVFTIGFSVICASKARRMPGAIQRRDVLAGNGFAAAVTNVPPTISNTNPTIVSQGPISIRTPSRTASIAQWI